MKSKRSKAKFKKVVLYRTTNETAARELAGWLSKKSKLVKCSVRKSVTVRGVNFIVTLRYKATIRATTFIQIGYQLCALTNGSVMVIERRKPRENSIAAKELPSTIADDILKTLLGVDDLPF